MESNTPSAIERDPERADDELDYAVDPAGNPVDTREYADDKPPSVLNYARDVDRDGVRVWIRLPNQFQHREVQRHAVAARRRKIRAMQDANSDAALVLESKMERFDDVDDDELREILTNSHLREAITQATIVIEHGDNPDHKQFSDMDSQKVRYDYLTRRGETDTDEFKALEGLIVAYAKELETEVEESLLPHRGRYATLDRAGMLELLRKQSAKGEADDEFMTVYNQWQLYYGTRRHDNHNKLHFASIDRLIDEDSHVIEVLVDEFSLLEAARGIELKKAVAVMTSSRSSER